MIKNLSEIEKTLNLEAGTLQKALEQEDEINVELPEIVVRTKEEQEAFISNIEAEKKERYDSGKEKGVKDLINANIESFGIDLEGKAKTFENFAEALENKLSIKLGKPKDEKVQALEQDNEKLRANLLEVENQFNTFKTEIDHEKTSYQIDSMIEKSIPTEGLKIPRDDLQMIFKNKFQPELSEGKLVLKQNGQLIKDEKTLNPKTLDQVMPTFLENYIEKQEKGAGGKDDAGKPNASSYEKLVSEYREKGVSESSLEFQRELQSRVKEGTVTI